MGHPMDSVARPAGDAREIPSLTLGAAAARSRRVALLLIAVAIVSIADLAMTLLFLVNWGLSEGNPFARAIMSYRSPGLVVAWKILTVGLAAFILWTQRRHRTAEVASWIAFGVMIWLSLQWAGYLTQIDVIIAEAGAADVDTPATWVSMAEAHPSR